MRVALVCHSIPHYRAAVLRELMNSPAHDYMLVADETSDDPSIKQWEITERNRFSAAPCRRFFSSVYVQKGLIKLAIRKDLDALIYLGNPYYVSTWVSAFAARLAGKRVLFWTHGWTRDEAGIQARLRSAFYKLSDGLLLYGHFGKMWGLAKGFKPERLHVIYNSLDYERQRKLREELRGKNPAAVKSELFARPDLPMVICSARLTRSCQFDLLLQAQAELRDQGHLINVLLVGDGPENPSLEAQALRLRIPVKFFGACYEESTLARLTVAAHVTVSPGKIGLTAIQSLAYGTPVITHDNHMAQGPEWEAIVPGRTGALFRNGDANDLARVIKEWTQVETPDPATRAECYKILDKFYNPAFQRRAIDRAVSGAPGDDLFWLREPAVACGA